MAWQCKTYVYFWHFPFNMFELQLTSESKAADKEVPFAKTSLSPLDFGLNVTLLDYI